MMSPELVRDLSSQLQTFELYAPVAAIICGMDKDGAHIYVARNSQIENRDWIGFAAIGAGDWHSNSQFMLAKHTREKLFLKQWC